MTFIWKIIINRSTYVGMCVNIFRVSEESSVSPSGNTGLSTAHRKGHGGAEQGIKDPAIVYSCSVYWIRKFTRGGRQPWKNWYENEKLMLILFEEQRDLLNAAWCHYRNDYC